MPTTASATALDPIYAFQRRHIGPDEQEIQQMLDALGFKSLDELIDRTIPGPIRLDRSLDLPAARSEFELLNDLREIAAKNEVYRSYLGMGYHDTITPPVIQRNIFENPNWYTQYTPYQAEISQGRLEMLLNFQTAVMDLTGMEIANASLLDEGTAAAEAMGMFYSAHRQKRTTFFVAEDCHPHTIAVVQTRAWPLGITVVVDDPAEYDFTDDVFGALVSYPTTDGAVYDYRAFAEKAHAAGAHVVAAADLLALALLTPPGEWGADIAVGNTQRFGVPLGYGGPHAAYMAAKGDFTRRMPGRIIGVSVDANGKRALRMALQTREQHIRREKATSNICTAQVLLAIMAAGYAIYHGPDGLKRIATRIHDLTNVLAQGLEKLGYSLRHDDFFDTIRVDLGDREKQTLLNLATARGINLRSFADNSIGIALDETVTVKDVEELWQVFGEDEVDFSAEDVFGEIGSGYEGDLARTSAYLEHPVFNTYHSETEMMRYLHKLVQRDLSLTTSMITLGSCTMKLNAAAELMPVSWPQFNKLHPFAPPEQAEGYRIITEQLSQWLAEITGFSAVSLQPNSGAQGEYAGLLVIRAYHESRGDHHRNVCLIPASAHGTNPASAVMAGMEVVVVNTDENGNVDVDDLRAKAEKHSANLSALMITYPSTHGVFEPGIRDICALIHEHGGQVYMDGANMNAQVGLCRPGDFGADVCHLNLHKTFAIPHGGGGPGMGPICCAEHLAPFLPSHPTVDVGGSEGIGPVASGPFGSASILLISWAYIAMLGAEGVTNATRIAILNANYMAHKLEEHYPVLYRGKNGTVAHEFILDLRPMKRESGITEEDVAKRLIDYGFHAPTMSWPVPGTIMAEPTESESRAELDRFCDALISIRAEIQQVTLGLMDRENNPLKNAPHTAEVLLSDEWDRPYSRQQAAYPAPWTHDHKFWPFVGRVDNAYGDRNLVCACPPIEEYA